ncbi:sensor histidine kinase [Aerosakkonema funiforme]|uniref:histidine kinase n=1 Tax=Aerosakkonema funiforme FACHB-1375 TaxID=2949571 RepID=A0A926VFP3_9CYAN|nr:HAMP domain-containing sensor histidine kinase [Aerosakkonema funiforme]MBD2181902.1 HAMP domain-containing histidine kinase [Aerosakkonema funiforme FACHB-1375]
MDSDSEIFALKEQLQKTELAYHMAAEMSQFKAGFLARISHELRSPLNSLIGLHQIILSDLCEDEAEEREFVAQAHGSALKMVALLDEILNVARTEYGTNKLEIQPLQLAQVLAQVYDLTHLLAANRNIRLQVTPTDPEIYVLADPRWLRQVLLNLVDTPLKLMQEGSVAVSAHPDLASGYVRIVIEDERPASAWSDPIDLFESPAQTDKSTDKSDDENFTLSPGLSLLISQTLLDLMKGRLEVLAVPSPSEQSHLTRLQCSIPLVTPQTP